MFCSFVSVAQITGKVVKVSDGDTFTMLLSGNQQVRIRLHGIDCPEKKQDYGNVAKQYTGNLVFGKIVKVVEMDTDRYGRTIGMVYLSDGRILNEELLKAGLAWHFLKYDKRAAWTEMERQARAKKIGLWQTPNPIAPWEFRKMK